MDILGQARRGGGWTQLNNQVKQIGGECASLEEARYSD